MKTEYYGTDMKIKEINIIFAWNKITENEITCKSTESKNHGYKKRNNSEYIQKQKAV